MQRASRQIESARIEKEEASFTSGDGREFREADVIAYRQRDLAIFGEVDERQFITWR